MRNEEKFKQRISEIAAKIAGVNEEYEDSKIDLPDSIKARINSSIANTKDLAKFLLDMMKEVIANEPGMEDIDNKSWKDIKVMLQRKAGIPADKQAEETPDVSSSDQEKLGIPDLKESFNRINRK